MLVVSALRSVPLLKRKILRFSSHLRAEYGNITHLKQLKNKLSVTQMVIFLVMKLIQQDLSPKLYTDAPSISKILIRVVCAFVGMGVCSCIYLRLYSAKNNNSMS